MNSNTKILIFLNLLVLWSVNLWAQEYLPDTLKLHRGHLLILNDTLIVPTNDTLIIIPEGSEYKIKQNSQFKSQAFYDSLRTKSGTRRWSKELANALLTNNSRTLDKLEVNVKAETEYLPYEGLIINTIELKKIDVFGGNVSDTTLKTQNSFAKDINAIHINTLDKVIRKNLVIKPGMPINAYQLADNERFLRNLNYIHDAKFIIVPIDSVQANVIVVTQDVYPIGLGFSFSTLNKFDIQLAHENLFGTGQSIKYRTLVNTKYSPVIGNQLEYSKSNMFNSFTTLYLRYRATPALTNWTARIRNEFVTTKSKYAYGLEYDNTRDSINLQYADTALRFGFKRNISTGWLARNFVLNESLRQNLVVAAKYSHVHYESRPFVNSDSNQYFQNVDYVLGSLTFFQHRSIKTRMLRGFGSVEDADVGYLVSVLGGYVWSELYSVFYAGIKLGYGHSFKKGGYLGVLGEYGSFYHKRLLEGVVRFKVVAYTSLIDIYRAKLRFGAKLDYKSGINRYPYEWVNLGDDIKGISSSNTKGTSKTVLGFETVLFTNSYFYGFRFAPYITGIQGLIRNGNYNFIGGNQYSGIGVGVRIRNENLVFQTFDLRLMYYPQRSMGDKVYRFIFEDREPTTFKGLYVGEPKTVQY